MSSPKSFDEVSYDPFLTEGSTEAITDPNDLDKIIHPFLIKRHVITMCRLHHQQYDNSNIEGMTADRLYFLVIEYERELELIIRTRVRLSQIILERDFVEHPVEKHIKWLIKEQAAVRKSIAVCLEQMALMSSTEGLLAWRIKLSVQMLVKLCETGLGTYNHGR